MEWLKGKVAVVTGGGRGIGKAISKTFAEHGAKVVINYRSNVGEAQATLDEIVRSGGNAIISQADVSCSKDQKKLLQDTLTAFGKIDILVNNAGITIRKSFFDCTEEDFDTVLSTNLKGVFFLSRFAAEEMKKQETAGSIINISSLLGLRPMGMYPQYEVAKAGVTMLTQSLAKTLAEKNIRVNTISPGVIETDISKGVRENTPEIWAKWTKNIPLGRAGKPIDIAIAALYLASGHASFTTGTNIVIDGGHTSYIPKD